MLRRGLASGVDLSKRMAQKQANMAIKQAAESMPELRVDTNPAVYAMTGLNEEIYTKRRVAIYQPARSATTQGRGNEGIWKLRFDVQPKWSNPLMGWTSGRDTFGTQISDQITFPNSESAVAFCKKHGMNFTVEEVQVSEVIQTAPRNYAENFRWDGDEDDGNCGESHWATRRVGTK